MTIIGSVKHCPCCLARGCDCQGSIRGRFVDLATANDYKRRALAAETLLRHIAEVLTVPADIEAEIRDLFR